MLRNEYNVKEFGAKGDSENLDHAAIQNSIDKCSADGGGTVYFPAGTYLCGTVKMKNNVCLYLETGSKILAAKDASFFPEISKTPFNNLPGQIQALIWFENVRNVTIEGQGAIEGNGVGPIKEYQKHGNSFRPVLIFCRDCENIKFLDINLQYSDFWTLHLMRCNDVKVRGITINNDILRINADGIDPDGCRNVVISDCNIKTGDDCIVLKSTEGDVCENIVITNCILSTPCAAFKIGTEGKSDIRNVAMNNCIMSNTNVAIALYMKDGSIYENIMLSNLIIDSYSDIPVIIDITSRYFTRPSIGKIKNINFNNITVNGKGCCYIEGDEISKVENVAFSNITWNVDGKMAFEKVIKPSGSKNVELDPNKLNYINNPYQFIVVNTDEIYFNNIKVYSKNKTEGLDRGIIYLNKVEGAVIKDVKNGSIALDIEPVRRI